MPDHGKDEEFWHSCISSACSGIATKVDLRAAYERIFRVILFCRILDIYS